MSPIGDSWVAGSGNRLLTATGLTFMALSPIGSVTQPWLPRYVAVRVTPLGSLTWTALLARSMTGLPSLARSPDGPGQKPTFSAAKSRARPALNSTWHLTFAHPPGRSGTGSA